MIRALVVDDSPTSRALLVAMLGSDPEIEVIGEAQDGRIAVELTARLRPDVIVMDIQMPRLDGIGATREIMRQTPTPIVITSGTLDVREVVVSMNALSAGALALFPKPEGPASPSFEKESQHFIATVKAMANVKLVSRRGREAIPAPAIREHPPITARAPSRPAGIVAIAASTGGPAALHRLLADLPDDFAVPVLVVQHMAVGFSQGFARWLSGAGGLRVKLADDGEALAPGTVYICPDGKHLVTERRGFAALTDAPPIGGFRPSGTALFESVARAYGSEAVAVMLSGMGRDGVEGLYELRRAGGRVFAQSEQSCVVFGMPREAVEQGLVDATAPAEALAGLLVQAARS